jgi:N-acyl-D-aspartate/D-glutamate deacylase
MAYDLLLKNGRIIDGSGRPAFQGDIGVAQGKIVELGGLGGSAHQVIEAVIIGNCSLALAPVCPTSPRGPTGRTGPRRASRPSGSPAAWARPDRHTCPG